MYLHLLAVVPIPPHEARTIYRLWRKDIELHCKKSLCCIVWTIYVPNFIPKLMPVTFLMDECCCYIGRKKKKISNVLEFAVIPISPYV